MRIVYEGDKKPHKRYMVQLWSGIGDFWFGERYFYTLWGARLSRWGMNNYAYRIIDTRPVGTDE